MQSSKWLEQFQWNFQENESNDNIKSHKKGGLYPLSRNKFEKTAVGSNSPPKLF